MRVALFTEVYWPMVSGVGVTLRRLADALLSRGHAVRVYTATYPVPRGQTLRPEVHRSPSIPFFLYPDVQWGFPRMRDVLQDAVAFRPEVVHVATEFAMGVAGIKAARQLDVPVLASAHTDYEKYATRYSVDWAVRAGWHYLRWFYGQSQQVLCPTRIYERHLNRRGVDNTGLWSRGIDPTQFHPRFRSETFRRLHGVEPGDLLVTYVGRIAREKNLDLLLAAWERLGGRRKRARLVLVGRGPLEEEIRRRAIPGVHLAGLLQDAALAEAYASADLFAFPSSTETFGNVLLEAMASGLPSVVAAAGGVVEFGRHGDNTWMVAPDDAGALCEGLDRLLTDGPLRSHLAAGALATAAERSWDVIYDDLITSYQAAVGRHRRQAREAA